jgi:excisionase family DNA binding protein
MQQRIDKMMPPLTKAHSSAPATDKAEFLTTRQLQEILHVDRTTIYRMADGGRVPAVKVGNQWRFPRRQIEAWLKTENDATVAADAGELSPSSVGGVETDIAKLLPLECVLKIQDTFSDLLGVMLVVTDLEGKPLTPLSGPGGLLRLVQQSHTGRRLCQEDWASLAAGPSVMPALQHGRLGLLQTRGLVRVGAEIKALVIAGGIAPQSWPPNDCETARLAELLDIDEADLRRQIGQVHHLDEAGQQTVVAYVQRVADIIAHIISERNLLFSRLQHIADLSQI